LISSRTLLEGYQSQEDSSFSEEKEAKRLLFSGGSLPADGTSGVGVVAAFRCFLQQRQVRKILLFLKKKKQKDFYSMAARSRLMGQAASALQKSFCFFFFRKRRILALPYLTLRR
jgi:hypothetical protein